LEHEHPTAPSQDEHEPDDPKLHHAINDPLRKNRYSGKYTVDDKVLVIPHGAYGTQVYQIYEAKPGYFLGPSEPFAEQVAEYHIHKDEDYHNRQKKGNKNFNRLKKGVQNFFHQTLLILLAGSGRKSASPFPLA
jgi:hypothetical protein